MLGVALAQVYFVAALRVPCFVDIVTLALACPLAVVEGQKVVGKIAGERVSHHEELVGARAAFGDEAGAQAFVALVVCALNVEGCRAGFQPDELPVEVELVLEAFARVEGGVLQRALSVGAYC